MMNSPTTTLFSEELRNADRKIFRCTANIVLDGSPMIIGRTIDISTVGISIMTPSALTSGALARLDLSTYDNRRLVTLNVPARVKYCICVGTEGFRIGFEFIGVDQITGRTIKKLSS